MGRILSNSNAKQVEHFKLQRSRANRVDPDHNALQSVELRSSEC